MTCNPPLRCDDEKSAAREARLMDNPGAKQAGMIALSGKSQSARTIPKAREACQGDFPARLLYLCRGRLRETSACARVSNLGNLATWQSGNLATTRLGTPDCL